MSRQQSQKCASLAAIVGYITTIYNFTRRTICRFSEQGFLFQESIAMVFKEKSIAMVFNETTRYDFILPSTQRHFETSFQRLESRPKRSMKPCWSLLLFSRRTLIILKPDK